ncbi:unnamed protein product, partial [Rotaria magnacalcarata]
ASDNDDVPEMWLPELWHTDSKTGKIKKHRLPPDETSLNADPITAEPELSNVCAPSGVLLPVEEEEGEAEEEEEESQIILS